ncbi:MAG: glutamate formimidoyltransferase [Solirubrobacterales bacterium]
MKLLAVPNFSEGRDEDVISALAGALGGSAAELLDTHADPIHHRAVFTLAGEPDQLSEALESAARKSQDLIDLRPYDGAHPHVGALDVCPIVYPVPARREAAEELAREVASAIAATGVPVMFYGDLATSPERADRAYFRRGGPRELARRMAAGEIEADLGPGEPHPSGGATLVTARPPLGAFNVAVAGIDLVAGRKIASLVRESGGGREGVRAIAIDIGDGRIQISTNIHDPAAVALARVVEDVWELARPLGGVPVEAEVIGLVPEAALEGYPEDVPIRRFEARQHTIEARLGE